MSDPEAELLGYLLGALDDAEHEAMERRLKTDLRLRAHLARACRNLQPLYHCEDEIEPPPGLADRTCRLVTQQAQCSRRDSGRRGTGRRGTGRAGPLRPNAAGPPVWWRRLRRPHLLIAALVLLAAVSDPTPPAAERTAPVPKLSTTLVSNVSRLSSPHHPGRSHGMRTRFVGDLGLVAAAPVADETMVTFSDASSSQQLVGDGP
jgi:hypothetical protein